MSKYFIRGTISAVCDEGKINEIRISPVIGFVTPEAKQRAIAFQTDPLATGEKALLMDMEDKKCLVFVDGTNIATHLLTIAVQQKLVELRLDKDKKIVGFVFPSL